MIGGEKKYPGPTLDRSGVAASVEAWGFFSPPVLHITYNESIDKNPEKSQSVNAFNMKAKIK